CACAWARACAGASQSLGGSDMASNAPRREGEPVEEVRERKGIKKGLYLLPSAFTAANIGMGYFAVMAALRGFQLLGGGTNEGAVQAATAQFDVQATRPRTLAEGTAKVDKKNFVGLPIPMAAGLLAAFVHFSPRPLITYGVYWSALYSGLVMALVAVLAVLMVSTLRYSSF